MGVTTWLDRITDESNLWLSASKAEESKDFRSAAMQYLSDAEACLSRGSLVRAALSTFCAAECLSAMGASTEADWLYSEAGRLYSRIADHGVSGSIREALWALQRAHACYSLAEADDEKKAILDSYLFLVRRANPFAVGSEWLAMPDVAPRRGGKRDRQVPVDPDLTRAIESLFVVREPSSGGGVTETFGPRRPRGMIDEQESLVSKLG